MAERERLAVAAAMLNAGTATTNAIRNASPGPAGTADPRALFFFFFSMSKSVLSSASSKNSGDSRLQLKDISSPVGDRCVLGVRLSLSPAAESSDGMVS